MLLIQIHCRQQLEGKRKRTKGQKASAKDKLQSEDSLQKSETQPKPSEKNGSSKVKANAAPRTTTALNHEAERPSQETIERSREQSPKQSKPQITAESNEQFKTEQ